MNSVSFALQIVSAAPFSLTASPFPLIAAGETGELPGASMAPHAAAPAHVRLLHAGCYSLSISRAGAEYAGC